MKPSPSKSVEKIRNTSAVIAKSTFLQSTYVHVLTYIVLIFLKTDRFNFFFPKIFIETTNSLSYSFQWYSRGVKNVTNFRKAEVKFFEYFPKYFQLFFQIVFQIFFKYFFKYFLCKPGNNCNNRECYRVSDCKYSWRACTVFW